MFNKLWWAFGHIFWRDQIPKLPRGMLASEYKTVTEDERRVMARMGTRDPIGVKRAMRLYGAKTAQELIEMLDHQQPKRNIIRRIWLGIGRLAGGEEKHPHQEEILQDARQAKKLQAASEIRDRLKSITKGLK
jgi:hypothetical protein